jgi:peptidoglycan/LPS O-acetylase OafA/YrhL
VVEAMPKHHHPSDWARIAGQGQLKPLALSPVALFMAVTAASLLGAWVLYRGVETPFMALRGRWIPTHFPPPRRADSASSGAETLQPK